MGIYVIPILFLLHLFSNPAAAAILPNNLSDFNTTSLLHDVKSPPPDCRWAHFSARDRTFCTNESLFCTGPVTSKGDCPSLHHCFLPAGLADGLRFNNTVNRTEAQRNYTTRECSSKVSILTTLFVMHVIDASKELLTGHQSVRDKMNLFRIIFKQPKTTEWNPTTGAFHAFAEIIWVLVGSAINQAANPGMQLAPMIALWLMRPRWGFLLLFFVKGLAVSNFNNTVWDVVVQESILNIVALPGALTFLFKSGTANRCGLKDWTIPDAGHFGHVLGYRVFSGAASCLILAYFCLRSLNGQMDTRLERRGEGILRSLVAEKKLILPLIVSMGSYISDWILWGMFIRLAGENYCDSGSVILLVLKAVEVAIGAVFRPIWNKTDGSGSSIKNEPQMSFWPSILHRSSTHHPSRKVSRASRATI